MAIKGKVVLGKGLGALIPKPSITEPRIEGESARAEEAGGAQPGHIAEIEIEKIQPNPYQPRIDFDQQALDELKQSIAEKGLVQPITVRRGRDGTYQLISGERRVRAAREAGLARIPAYIIEVKTDEEMLELALIENLQREHLNPCGSGNLLPAAHQRVQFHTGRSSQEGQQGPHHGHKFPSSSETACPDPAELEEGRSVNGARSGSWSTSRVRNCSCVYGEEFSRKAFQSVRSRRLSVTSARPR